MASSICDFLMIFIDNDIYVLMILALVHVQLTVILLCSFRPVYQIVAINLVK